MTLEQFAKKAGFVLLRLDDEDTEMYGGRFGYTTTDDPHSSVCGFKTEAAAYAAFVKDTFGVSGGRAVLALLKELKTLKEMK